MILGDALSGVTRLFIDTAPIIYHVEGVAKYQPLTDAVFDRIDAGEILAVTSTITLAESLVLPMRIGAVDLVARFEQVISRHKHTLCVGIDSLAHDAAALCATYKLSLPDAFQMACAKATGCQGFLTNDFALQRIGLLRTIVLDELTLN